MATLPQNIQSSILANLTDLQKRQRRAAQLRGSQDSFAAMKEKPGKGNYTPTQQGGLYQTIGKYQKDWEGLGNQLVGSLGGYLSGRKADKAEDALNELRNGQILGTVQQIATNDQGPLAQQSQSMNDYLGVQSAPKSAMPIPGMGGGLAAAAAAPPEVQSMADGRQMATAADGTQASATFTDLSPEAGQRIAALAASLEQQGLPPDVIGEQVQAAWQQEKAAAGSETTATAGPAMAAPTTAGAADPPAGVPQMPQAGQPPAPPQMPAPGPQQAPPQGPPQDFMAAMGLPAGQFGVPETAPGAAMEAPQEQEAPLADETLRAYLGMIGGDDIKGLTEGRRLIKTVNIDGGKIKSYFSDGSSEISDDIAESKSRLFWDKGTGQIKRVYTTGPRQGTSEDVADPITGEPLQMTKEDALQKRIAIGRAEGEDIGAHNTRGLAAETAGAVKGAEATEVGISKEQVDKYYGASKAATKMDAALRPAEDAMDRLVNPETGEIHPGLKGLTPDQITGWFDPDSRLQRVVIAKLNPKAADALADLEQVRGGTFVEGFMGIVGQGAGSIDKNEGSNFQRSIGNLTTARSVEDIAAEIRRIRSGTRRVREGIQKTVDQGPYYRPSQSGATGNSGGRNFEEEYRDD